MIMQQARFNVEITAYKEFNIEGDFQEVSVVGKSGFSFQEAEERAFQKLWNVFKVPRNMVNRTMYIYMEPHS